MLGDSSAQRVIVIPCGPDAWLRHLKQLVRLAPLCLAVQVGALDLDRFYVVEH